jgi:cytoskeleton protein RodZ
VLPGGIFPRAFVRQYAAYLGLDPDRTVNDFIYAHGEGVAPGGGAAPVRHPVSHAVLHAPSAAPAGRNRTRFMLVGAGVAAVAALAWVMLRPKDEPGAASVAPSTPPPSSFAPDVVYPPPTSATTLAAGPARGELVVGITTREDCWVSVQADGVKIVDRVMTQGETQTVSARTQVVLSVGNAGGVSFTVNGRPGVPLGAQGEVRRGVVITQESLPSLVQDGPSPPAPSPGPGG